jgi:hypothetical protein
MTRQAEFKRRVRARMAKTGESYATARAQLLAARDPLGRERLTAALHVTNGDSAAEGLRATGLARRILPWRDALHEGPVPDVPDPELRRIRAAFLVDDDPPGGGSCCAGSSSATGPWPPAAAASTCCGSRPTCTTSCSSSRSWRGWASCGWRRAGSP